MSLNWMRLAQDGGASELRENARRDIDYVKRTQKRADANDAVRGGIAGSSPNLGRLFALRISQLGIVKLHGGLSPEYRGADCTFWALYNGEPEKIGCTLHFIDSGIDSGKLIADVCPEVHEGDDELTLFWRAVRDSAEVYAEALERFARGEALGMAQPGNRRLYQVKQRGLRHERRVADLLDSGLLKGVALPLRGRWFQKGRVA
jgi:hypothetical protein